MDQHQRRFNGLTGFLGSVPSRRGLLRGLAAAGLGTLRLPGATEARNKKKRKKRKQRGMCQDGKKVGEVLVSGSGSTFTTPVLEEGRRYRLRASGFWNSNPTHRQDAFADYEIANPNATVTTNQGVRLGLSVNCGSPDQWGSYNSAHIYVQEVTGQGAALSLKCNDVAYDDNSGSVRVEVFCAA